MNRSRGHSLQNQTSSIWCVEGSSLPLLQDTLNGCETPRTDRPLPNPPKSSAVIKPSDVAILIRRLYQGSFEPKERRRCLWGEQLLSAFGLSSYIRLLRERVLSANMEANVAGKNICRFSRPRFCAVLIISLFGIHSAFASPMQSPANRRVSGVVADQKGQVLNGITVVARAENENDEANNIDTVRRNRRS